MVLEIGHIQAIYRYPVKSMAGEQLDVANLGWHGLDGDRRFAVRQVAKHDGFPWLTASKLPQMILFKPVRDGQASDEVLPTHVCTPDGKLLPIRSDELRDDLARRFGAEVELMQLNHGIFDEAPISVISLTTTQKITDQSGNPPDIRRFRPNIVIHTHQNEPFLEDEWVGKTLVFGDEENSPSVTITLRDVRCVMVNLNPETAKPDSSVLKTVVHLNQNCAGVYGTVIQLGALAVGQKVYLKTS